MSSDEHLLRCYSHIELNPVRAGMVPTPRDYRWSRHAANAQGARDDPVVSHPLHLALGRTPIGRCAAYRDVAAEATLTEEHFKPLLSTAVESRSRRHACNWMA